MCEELNKTTNAKETLWLKLRRLKTQRRRWTLNKLVSSN